MCYEYLSPLFYDKMHFFGVIDCLTDAKRVAEHSPHILDGSCLEVSLIEDRVAEGDLMDVDREMNNLDEGSGANAAGITIMASGILPSSTDDAIRNYFENSRRSGGGEICDFNFYAEEGIAVITFSEVEGNYLVNHVKIE